MAAIMKLKSLESHLQDLDGFDCPNVQLEQYVTPPHIAAVVLHNIQTQYGALEDKIVLDAGCGPGILGIGASLLGASAITGLDIDRNALEVFRNNIDEVDVTNVDIIQSDFLLHSYRCEKYFDTVLMNPPFGTKHNAGMDMRFLRMGLHLSCDSVYSLHKSSTRSHIQKKIVEWGVKGNVVAELKYNLEASYKFHKQKSRDIAVDLWRIYH